jgi:hypothetical protein
VEELYLKIQKSFTNSVVLGLRTLNKNYSGINRASKGENEGRGQTKWRIGVEQEDDNFDGRRNMLIGNEQHVMEGKGKTRLFLKFTDLGTINTYLIPRDGVLLSKLTVT